MCWARGWWDCLRRRRDVEGRVASSMPVWEPEVAGVWAASLMARAEPVAAPPE